VASQIDSRTILDFGGAEKLLGGGDMLFTSSEMKQPRRIQGAYVTENEIAKVAGYVRENNTSPEDEPAEDVSGFGDNSVQVAGGDDKPSGAVFDAYMESNEEDDLYQQAVETVAAAKKASASLLQRRLSVGYARAARLLDMMEERGVIGPDAKLAYVEKRIREEMPHKFKTERPQRAPKVDGGGLGMGGKKPSERLPDDVKKVGEQFVK